MSGSDYLNSADDDYDLSYDPPPPPKRSGRMRMFMGIAAVLVVLAGAGVIGSVVLRGNATDAGGDAVRLEPTSFAGANPFVSPVGKDEQVSAVAAGGEFSGATSALYARNPAIPSCDGQKLVAALQADGKRAAAWASAEKIQAADIPAFVSTLTPVLLRADTSVTAFGYDDPSFFSYPAVLQAGTAVFINGRGEPTVKCYNGNPLASRSQPAPTVARTVSYVGPRWTTFRTTSVTVIRPSTTINKVFCFGGTGVGGVGGAGGNGPAAGSGGNGGNGTGGVGCQIGAGGTKVTDCTKQPKAAGCTPPPPPVPTPSGPNCTKNPTECPTTPGDSGDCMKDPKAAACQVTPPAECAKDPKAANCTVPPVTPPAECAKDPKAANCTVPPVTPPAECAKDPKAAVCTVPPVTLPAECATAPQAVATDPKAAVCPVVPPSQQVDCAKEPTAAGCAQPGTPPAGTGNTTPGTGTGPQTDPVQQADPAQQQAQPAPQAEPVQQQAEPAQQADPVQQADADQPTGGGAVHEKKHDD